MFRSNDLFVAQQVSDGGENLVCGGRRTGGAVVAGGILEPTVGRGWVNQWGLADLKATKVASLPAEVRWTASSRFIGLINYSTAAHNVHRL